MPVQWSNSSDWALRKCQRQFWFRHLHASPQAKWGSPRRETSILSNVNTLEQWRGNVVHGCISDYVIPLVINGKQVSENGLLEFAIDRAERQIAFSSQKRYRENGMTKTKAGDAYAIIWEDEFRHSISRLTIQEAFRDIEQALKNLLRLTDVTAGLYASSWMAAEASIDHQEQEIRVTGRIDLMAIEQRTSRVVTLYDWKVDQQQSRDYAPQLWLYAYLLDKAKRYQDNSYQPQTIPPIIKNLPKRLLEVNLLHGTTTEHDWNERRLANVEDRIFKGTRTIRALLDGREPGQVQGDELSVTKNANNCLYCPFRQPCQKLG